MIYFVVGMLAMGAVLIVTVFEQARRNRAAGLTPDGAPLPDFGDYVEALLDAPLQFGGRTIRPLGHNPATVEGVVLKVFDDMTMEVMDDMGERYHCLVVGYVIPEHTPSWVYEFLNKPNPNRHIH